MIYQNIIGTMEWIDEQIYQNVMQGLPKTTIYHVGPTYPSTYVTKIYHIYVL